MTRHLTRHHARALLPLVAAGAFCLACLPAAWAASGVNSYIVSAASAVPMDVRARPMYGPLSAGQITQIQSLSHSVLAAKHAQQPTAEESALAEELHSLTSEINKAALPKEEKLELSSANEQQSRVASGEVLRNQLQPHLTRLHERRRALMSSTPSQLESMDAHQTRMRYLNDQAAEIERTVNTALALPEGARRLRLVELSHQLEPRGLGELQRGRGQLGASEPSANAASATDLDFPTPTLSTLIRHRPGLDSSSAEGISGSIPQAVSRPAGKHSSKH